MATHRISSIQKAGRGLLLVRLCCFIWIWATILPTREFAILRKDCNNEGDAIQFETLFTFHFFDTLWGTEHLSRPTVSLFHWWIWKAPVERQKPIPSCAPVSLKCFYSLRSLPPFFILQSLYLPLFTRLSSGGCASAGMAHWLPIFTAGIRPSAIRRRTLPVYNPCFSQNCVTDRYSIDFSRLSWYIRCRQGALWCSPLLSASPHAVQERGGYFTLTAFTAKSSSRATRQIMYRTTLFRIGLTSLLSEVCAPWLRYYYNTKSFKCQ